VCVIVDIITTIITTFTNIIIIVTNIIAMNFLLTAASMPWCGVRL
jgi:hypothetical protein